MRLLLICSVLLLSSCATNSLKELVQVHPDYDVSQLKTFIWAEPPVRVIGILSGSGESQLTDRAHFLPCTLILVFLQNVVHVGKTSIRIRKLFTSFYQILPPPFRRNRPVRNHFRTDRIR